MRLRAVLRRLGCVLRRLGGVLRRLGGVLETTSWRLKNRSKFGLKTDILLSVTDFRSIFEVRALLVRDCIGMPMTKQNLEKR